MGFIYKITSPTGRLYVGQTKHIQRRIGAYKHKLVNNYGWKNAMIMNSLKKYGWSSHKFEIIEECENEQLNEREIFWIKELDTYCFENPKNMNMSRGGESGAKPWMFDTKRREEQSKRFSGTGNPFYGKTQSKEWSERKSKEVSEYNLRVGRKVPEWGSEKGLNLIRKPVLCYNSNGDFITEYSCASKAAKELKLGHTSISQVCLLKRTHVGWFVFRYKTENYPLKIDVGELKKQAVKKDVLMFLGKKIIEFESAKEASAATGVPITSIRRACAYNNLHPLRNGMKFIYKELYKVS